MRSLDVLLDAKRGMTGVVCFLLKMGDFYDKINYVSR